MCFQNLSLAGGYSLADPPPPEYTPRLIYVLQLAVKFMTLEDTTFVYGGQYISVL
jgi:hypothetical protein